MKPAGIYSIISIDEFSATPKYQQIINAVLKGIEHVRLQKEDMLPSINDLSYELDVSRDTAEKAYRYLKKIGVLSSYPGKGYFIRHTHVAPSYNICLLFNKLSAHKKIIYDSFVEAMDKTAAIDFYIYNNDFALFKRLLSNKKEEYSHYIIIPHFVEGEEKAHEVINLIPKEKLLLLDKKIAGITGNYAAVYENFSQDIFNALQQAKERLQKYHTIKIIFPQNSYYSSEIIDGFSCFCKQNNFKHKVISSIENETLTKGDVYIAVMEDDLVKLTERLLQLHFKAGKDVGIISYNETPIKKIILEGITTISTDFAAMGNMAAKLIIENTCKHYEVPFKLTMRNSL